MTSEQQLKARMRSAADEITRVIRRELDDAETAASRGDSKTAASEIDDAIRKLRRIVSDLGG